MADKENQIPEDELENEDGDDSLGGDGSEGDSGKDAKGKKPGKEAGGDEGEEESNEDADGDGSDGSASGGAEGSEGKRQKTAEEIEADRERRRQQRQRKAYYRKKNKEELEALKKKIADMEQAQAKQSQFSISQYIGQVDTQISQVRTAMENAQAARIAAITSGNVMEQVRAEDAYNEGRDALRRLEDAKRQATGYQGASPARSERTSREDDDTQSKGKEPPTARADGLTPKDQQVQIQAAAWKQRMHSDHGSQNWSRGDWSIVQQLEAELWNETDEDGYPAYDARSPEYFSELTERIKEARPQLLKAPAASQRSQSRPKVAGGGSAAGGTGSQGGGDALAKGIPADVIREWRSAGMWKDKDQKLRMRANYFAQLKSSQ